MFWLRIYKIQVKVRPRQVADNLLEPRDYIKVKIDYQNVNS